MYKGAIQHMDKIVEYKGYFGVKYKRIRGNRPYEVMVVGITKKYNDFTYMMVIGTNGKVYFETYKYLNKELENQGYSKRNQALRALKLLFSYIELFNTELRYIDVDDRNRLIAFIQGGQRIGQKISYESKTTRNNGTVNSYLGVYRDFYKFIGIKDNIFQESSGIQKVVLDSKVDTVYYRNN